VSKKLKYALKHGTKRKQLNRTQDRKVIKAKTVGHVTIKNAACSAKTCSITVGGPTYAAGSQLVRFTVLSQRQTEAKHEFHTKYRVAQRNGKI
jgi:hypothetical protein